MGRPWRCASMADRARSRPPSLISEYSPESATSMPVKPSSRPGFRPGGGPIPYRVDGPTDWQSLFRTSCGARLRLADLLCATTCKAMGSWAIFNTNGQFTTAKGKSVLAVSRLAIIRLVSPASPSRGDRRFTVKEGNAKTRQSSSRVVLTAAGGLAITPLVLELQ